MSTGPVTSNHGPGRTLAARGADGQVPTLTLGVSSWVDNGARTATAKTEAYTALFGDVVLGDTTNDPFNVTLPTPTSATQAPVTVVRTAGAFDITVVGTIDGASDTTVTTEAKTFVTDGTDWYTI